MDTDPVGSIHCAGQRITIRPVTALATSKHCVEHAGAERQASDYMIFSVNDIQAVVTAGIGNSLGAIEGRMQCGSTVSGIAPLPSSSEALQVSCRQVNLKNRIAFSQHQIGVAITVAIDGAGP
jgi:hypothetical protein